MLAAEPSTPRRRRRREAGELRRGDEVFRAHQAELRLQARWRNCLRCDHPFLSQHHGVRLCNDCRQSLGWSSSDGHQVRTGRAGYGI